MQNRAAGLPSLKHQKHWYTQAEACFPLHEETLSQRRIFWAAHGGDLRTSLEARVAEGLQQVVGARVLTEATFFRVGGDDLVIENNPGETPDDLASGLGAIGDVVPRSKATRVVVEALMQLGGVKASGCGTRVRETHVGVVLVLETLEELCQLQLLFGGAPWASAELAQEARLVLVANAILVVAFTGAAHNLLNLR